MRTPKATWDVNVGGTVNLLEASARWAVYSACVVVTSDKCYENREQVWGYREYDPMGGHDPYSSSKGACELAVSSWRSALFHSPDALRLASARAGNVIGGGDWSRTGSWWISCGASRRGIPWCCATRVPPGPGSTCWNPLSGYLALAAGCSGPMAAGGRMLGISVPARPV